MCRVTCDRVVYPSGCVDSGCAQLYAAARHGRAVMGCRKGVFRAEIDIERFELAQRSRFGFGALRAERHPLEVCRTSVEEAFPHQVDEGCRNPEFLLDELRRRVLNLGEAEAEPASA